MPLALILSYSDVSSLSDQLKGTDISGKTSELHEEPVNLCNLLSENNTPGRDYSGAPGTKLKTTGKPWQDGEA